MSRNLRFKVILVFIVLMASLWALYPTFRVVTMKEADRDAMEIESPEAYDYDPLGVRRLRRLRDRRRRERQVASSESTEQQGQ